ncbi:hypothetical protein Y032_0034g2846 [Ancylostoma ceylanicum]|nr:hypothetical protein Y032_0034g2846 [Ancylostoma ceylanicum]
MVLFSQVQSETLLERLAQERQHPKRRLLQEFVVGSDAIAGPHSLNEVGTFAGRPIIARQGNVFVDNQGVPVPILGDRDEQPAKRPPRRRRLFLPLSFE